LFSGISVALLASLCAAVFVLAINNQSRLRHFPTVRLFELGVVWYLPVIFSFIGAYILISGAINSK
jgi:hypothetical protein